MRLLLDTNAYTALRVGEPVVTGHFRAATGLLLSPIVVGELMHGFRCGNRFDDNVAQLRQLLDHPLCKLVQPGWDTAWHFARIAKLLRDKGRPIGSNDLWIAAQCIEHGATLLSCDGDFAAVDGLAWIATPRPA